MPGTTITAGHHIENTEPGCRQALTVDLSGPAARILSRLIGRQISRSLAIENEAFKRRAEQHDRPA